MKIYDEARAGAVQRARGLRRNSTEAEKRLWRALRAKLPQYKWRRQMPVGPYFADIACFGDKLIIEVDGGQHASSEACGAQRTRFMEAQGFRLTRFWNNDVLSNVLGVIENIAEQLKSSPSHCSAMGPSLSLGRGNLEPSTCQ